MPIINDLFEIQPQKHIINFANKNGFSKKDKIINRVDLILRQTLDFSKYFLWSREQEQFVDFLLNNQ
jgi:hypothetical protein